MVSFSEWVSEVCDGLNFDFMNSGKRLSMVFATIVKLGNVIERVDFFDVKSFALGAESDAIPFDPNIFSDNAVVDFLPAARVVHVLVV